jgi:nucleoid DNA-binding protein
MNGNLVGSIYGMSSGVTIAIPATKVVGFKAGKALKDAINTIYKK